LVAHGVLPEVVPGLTSALGAAASCQVPLTHRTFGVNQVRFVVGQNRKMALPDFEWAELARDANKQTTVFYMGFKSLARICKNLLDAGAEKSTPMVVVESATTPQERVFHGTLSTLPDIAKKHEAEITGPVLMILGPTAKFPAHLEEISGGRPLKRPRVGSCDAC